MKSCCNVHDEILFYGGECPVCGRDVEIFELNEKLQFEKSAVSGLIMDLQNKENIISGLKKEKELKVEEVKKMSAWM